MARNLKLENWILLMAVATILGCRGSVPYDTPHKQGEYIDPPGAPLPRNEEVAAETFPPAYKDHFHKIDGKADGKGYQPLDLEPLEIKGRNAWMLWTGGNELFWDWLSKNGYGSVDFLRLIGTPREGRFDSVGLINEPGMRPPAKEETAATYGIRFDRHLAEPDPESLPSEAVYGKSTGIVGLRLFENPDFKSDATAQRIWNDNVDRFYSDDPEDRKFFSNPNLKKPYLVGISCAICHASFHPLNPPGSVDEPKWENISSTIGAQFMRARGVFANMLQEDNYLYHVTDSQLPGTIDTSLIATDHINNANTMNAIFGLKSRIIRSLSNPMEKLTPDSFGDPDDPFPGLWETDSGYQYPLTKKDIPKSILYLNEDSGASGEYGNADDGYIDIAELFEGNPRHVPRILVDGSDSNGSWIALARVYMNIGTYHQQWARTHNVILGYRGVNPLLGFQNQEPFKLADCEEKSLYWHATKIRVDAMTAYFLKASDPMLLKDAIPKDPNLDRFGLQDMKEDWGIEIKESEFANKRPTDVALKTARKVFAKGCIACHSSKQPDTFVAKAKTEYESGDNAADSYDGNAKNKEILVRARTLTMDDLWQLTHGTGKLPDDYAKWAQAAVETVGFWEDNYLSTDMRIPVTMTETNSARAMATNAKHGHMWEDFASLTYKELPSVGMIEYRDPFSLATKKYQSSSGGPGYYRVPTLISAWATAPFLHNNALGNFNNDPSVEGRLECFDDAIEKLLWPAKRLSSSHDLAKLGVESRSTEELKRDGGLIWRTSRKTHFKIAGHQVPSFLYGFTGLSRFWVSLIPWLPGIAFIVLIILILARDALYKTFKRIESWLPPVASLIRISYYTLGFVLVLASLLLFYFVWWKYASTFRLIEIGSNWSAPWINLQVLLLLFAILVSGAAILIPRFPRPLVTTTYLACAILFALGFGTFASGSGGDLQIGPFPKGMPVNLVVNLNTQSDLKDLLEAGKSLSSYMKQHANSDASPEEQLSDFETSVAPALMNVSNCPDLVLDRGHDYKFMQQLTDEEKAHLILLIKTF